MRKAFLLLILMLGISLSGFAQSEKSAVDETVKTVVNKTKEAPAGIVYGLVKETKDEAIVNTPIGEYRITKKDGGYSFLGFTAKIESHEGNVYIVNSSVGRFKVNVKKCTITKL